MHTLSRFLGFRDWCYCPDHLPYTAHCQTNTHINSPWRLQLDVLTKLAGIKIRVTPNWSSNVLGAYNILAFCIGYFKCNIRTKHPFLLTESTVNSECQCAIYKQSLLLPSLYQTIMIECKKLRKGKAVPLEVLTGADGFRRLRLPDFKTIGIWRW